MSIKTNPTLYQLTQQQRSITISENGKCWEVLAKYWPHLNELRISNVRGDISAVEELETAVQNLVFSIKPDGCSVKITL